MGRLRPVEEVHSLQVPSAEGLEPVRVRLPRGLQQDDSCFMQQDVCSWLRLSSGLGNRSEELEEVRQGEELPSSVSSTL
ncbi:hypothetical protein HPB49_010109 [Dermacentor silvarum]|uniref:Uncharacterized protein n=1 Tax=Dermacentor silvarum TaxID=543639 RepID=A0ACB8C2Y4_DERSI|nr:hypothetical protein HPB49_010109 [Dermacentor silvarum]